MPQSVQPEDQNQNLDPKVPLGIGIAIGISLLYILTQVWPLLLLSGAGYLVYKGIKNSTRINNIECEHGQDPKNNL